MDLKDLLRGLLSEGGCRVDEELKETQEELDAFPEAHDSIGTAKWAAPKMREARDAFLKAAKEKQLEVQLIKLKFNLEEEPDESNPEMLHAYKHVQLMERRAEIARREAEVWGQLGELLEQWSRPQ